MRMILEMFTNTNKMIRRLLKIFFAPLKLHAWIHFHPLFEVPKPFWALKWVSKRKNECGLTFASIKNDWDVARLPRLLCWMPTMLRMSAKTIKMIRRCVENFLAPLKVKHHTRLHPLFEAFERFTALLSSIMSIKTQKSLCLHVCAN